MEEGGLARNISILRKALGEKPDDHQYIITVPGRGYQWVAEVHQQLEEPRTEVKASTNGERNSSTRTGFSGFGWRILGGLAAVVAGLAGYTLVQSYLRSAPDPAIQSIAVLPLENLSGDPAQEYLADGMTEALINSLAQVRALRVVSRTSVMRFKQTTKPVPEIARELDVDAIMSGSFHQAGGRVKITIQLIQAPTDTHLWAGQYERDLADILKLHSDVARAVTDEVRVQVTPDERSRMASASSVNPEAYAEYLKGSYFRWKFIEKDRLLAIQHFERAIQIDPNFAPAYAGLSHTWWARGVLGPLNLKEVQAPARQAAEKALTLDDRLGEAYAARAYVQGIFDWNWTEAERTVRQALDVGPNNLDVHYVYALLLMAQGRVSESITQIESAAAMDPLSAQVQSTFGRVLSRARRFEEAVMHLKQAIELEPRNTLAIARLGDVYAYMGRYDDAIAQYDKLCNPGWQSEGWDRPGIRRDG